MVNMLSDSLEKIIGIVLPFVLLVTTAIAFIFFSKFCGKKRGYFLGFLLYWSVWCLLVPIALITPEGLKQLFSLEWDNFHQHKWTNILCLLVPLLFAYAYAFPKSSQSATKQIVVLSLILAIVNATSEEVLWRGLYLKLFGSNKTIYILYSSIGFAIWHFAPQTVFRNREPGGQVSFVAFAFVFGLFYAVVAFNTRSILLTTISHVLLDFSGLGARSYLTKE